MSDKTIEQRVMQVISEQLGVAEADVKPEHHIVNDLGADSLDEVELVMALEDEFEMEIPDEVADQRLVVSQMIEWLTANVKQ